MTAPLCYPNPGIEAVTRFARPIAICVIQRDGKILVFEAYDATKDQTFYRPLGGAIEFGEYSEDAVVRELSEEIGAELTDVHLLGVTENVYVYDGEQGHEVVFIYEASLVDEALYDKAEMTGDEGGQPFKVVWKTLDAFDQNAAPLYPDGLLELITSRPSDHRGVHRLDAER